MFLYFSNAIRCDARNFRVVFANVATPSSLLRRLVVKVRVLCVCLLGARRVGFLVGRLRVVGRPLPRIYVACVSYNFRLLCTRGYGVGGLALLALVWGDVDGLVRDPICFVVLGVGFGVLGAYRWLSWSHVVLLMVEASALIAARALAFFIPFFFLTVGAWESVLVLRIFYCPRQSEVASVLSFVYQVGRWFRYYRVGLVVGWWVGYGGGGAAMRASCG